MTVVTGISIFNTATVANTHDDLCNNRILLDHLLVRL